MPYTGILSPVLSVLPGSGNESRSCLYDHESKDERPNHNMCQQQVRSRLGLLPGHNPKSSAHDDDHCCDDLQQATSMLRDVQMTSSASWQCYECEQDMSSRLMCLQTADLRQAEDAPSMLI